MDLVLDSDADPRVREAVRAAIARASVELSGHASADESPWWSAGLAAAVARGGAPVEGHVLYEAARSRRSTRGATRA